ncbi:OsmC family protein [Actinomyces vulturis]|uniref:OsmC family protein n=1 Tax=Actinomyces vulturis TaxID=1857645 RepID=UPI000834CE43|nr:OsmC family protein [Actinomyces vulturis]
MTENTTNTAPVPYPAPAVWAERLGTRQYLGRNEAGAEVKIGIGPGMFSPGELLKLALATCHSLSADHRLAKALGEDFDAIVGCTTVKNDEEERYDSFTVELCADYSSLTEEEREKLTERAQAAVDRHCTVGHTLSHGAQYVMKMMDDAGPKASEIA